MTPFQYFRYLRDVFGYRPAQARVSVLMRYSWGGEELARRMRRNWEYWKYR